MRFFEDLGALVEQRWRDVDYNEEAFPKIAEQALTEMPPYQHVDPWEPIRWLNTTVQLPEQRDIAGRFGNPPITLFNGPRFYIDIYYWLDGTTSIHQHSFCGAFQVLLGSSIHSQYRFDEKHKINEHFAVGEINLASVELLETGGIRQILPGGRYIHSLFHLDRPSATIIIRTQQTPSCLPQHDYHKPHFATDPFYQPVSLVKQYQSASLLMGMKHPDAEILLGELLSRSDFQTAFSIIDLAHGYLAGDQLERAFGLTSGRERYDALLAIARKRHGNLVDFIQPVIEERQRQQNLIQRRGQVTSNDHRFFLALLLNVPDRVKVLELVEQRFSDRSPVETVTDWVEELANTKVMGATEANVLGINDFDDDYLLVLQSMLEGYSLEQTEAAFEKEFSADYAASLGDKPAQAVSIHPQFNAFQINFSGPACDIERRHDQP